MTQPSLEQRAEELFCSILAKCAVCEAASSYQGRQTTCADCSRNISLILSALRAVQAEGEPRGRVCACNYAMIPKTLLVQHVCTKCGRVEVDDRRTAVLEPDDDLSKLATEIDLAVGRSDDYSHGSRYAAIYGAISAHVVNRTIWRTLRAEAPTPSPAVQAEGEPDDEDEPDITVGGEPWTDEQLTELRAIALAGDIKHAQRLLEANGYRVIRALDSL